MRLDYKTKLLLLLAAMATGYVWLAFNLFHLRQTGVESGITVCLFKNISGIPCPSCGTTRSIIKLLEGDFNTAVYINPLGVAVFILLVIFTVLLLIEITGKKRNLPLLAARINNYIRRPIYAIPLICLMTVNWVWNIYKSL